ncbi:hypothetical protein [Chryseobacterium capnotolerans]|uniref:hypothetical protein n=1 Tax=Chryseobacterium capnotolerans TaxID=2759528 RepID=UPI001E3E8D7D|nr:hypothetical protein [Chryseobacterium capnotolerans]
MEIKPAKTPEIENEITQKTIKMIKDMKLESQSEFISFSLNICKEIKKIAPAFKVQYLNGELSPEQIKKKVLMGWIITTVFSRKTQPGLLKLKL